MTPRYFCGSWNIQHELNFAFPQEMGVSTSNIILTKQQHKLYFFAGKKAEKTTKTKRQSGNFTDIKDFLADNIQKAEEAADRRHQDRMQCFQSLIGVLKSSIDKTQNE